MELTSGSLCSSTCSCTQTTNEPSILHLCYSVFYFHHNLLIHSISIFVYITHLFFHVVDLIHQSQHINRVVLNFLMFPTCVKHEWVLCLLCVAYILSCLVGFVCFFVFYWKPNMKYLVIRTIVNRTLAMVSC